MKFNGNKKWWIYVATITLLIILIKWYVISQNRVESTYSSAVYPGMANFFRILTGWSPISVGDILYALIILWLLVSFVKFILSIFKRTISWQKIIGGFKRTFIIGGLVYIIFNGLWGMNYDRLGIAHQLQLKMQPYSMEDLQKINALLLTKVNEAKLSLINSQTPYPSTKELFGKVKDAYDKLGSVYPFLSYPVASIKPSIWGWVGNYTGFTGYYNPFTGEGQVNTSIPKFLQPYTTCHEVAHQIGYAKEMEANFVGYLAASVSSDTLFHYSVYLDLFLYSNRNLMAIDSSSAKKYAEQLLPAIKEDLSEWRAFNRRHQTPLEPLIKWSYAKYLENNRQPQGMMAYDEVTTFLIAYYKKFGRI